MPLLSTRAGRKVHSARRLADERSCFVTASLSRDQELIYPPVQEFRDAAVAGGRGA
jgi:hypothetical protein